MKKHSVLLLATVLLLGWAFDFLFWLKPVGINFAIFLTLCLLGGFILLRTNGLKPGGEKPMAAPAFWLLCRHHLYSPGTTGVFPCLFIYPHLPGPADDKLYWWAVGALQLV